MESAAAANRGRAAAHSDSDNDAGDDAPDYETAPRQANPDWVKPEGPRLPLKLADGSVLLQAPRPRRVQEVEGDAAGAEGSGVESDGEDGAASPKAAVSHLSKKQQRREATAAAAREKAAAKAAARKAAAAAAEAEEEDEDGSDSDSEDDDAGASAPAEEAANWAAFAAMSPAAVEARRADLRLQIAEFCEAIIADPEHNVREATAAEVRTASKYVAIRRGGAGGGDGDDGDDGDAGSKKKRSKQALAKEVSRRLAAKRRNTLLSLHRLCSDADPYVRQLAMLSCVAVFRDVAPTYRIRLPSAAEKAAEKAGAARVSKEVKKLREFEAALLAGYQRFLRYLEATALKGERASARIARGRGAPGSSSSGSSDGGEDGGGSDGDDADGDDAGFDRDARFDPAEAALNGGGKEGDVEGEGPAAKRARLSTKDFVAIKMAARREKTERARGVTFYEAPDATLAGLAVTAVRAMGELLQSLPHFNFRANLIGFLVPRMGARETAIATLACGAVGETIGMDAAGEASHEIVRALNALVKKGCRRRGGLARVRPAAIAVLHRLRLSLLDVSSAGGKAKGKGQGKGAAALSREGQLKAGADGKKGKRTSGHHGEDPFDKADVLAGLAAADAEGLDERRSRAAACLRDTLNIYFRLLRGAAGAGGLHLLPPVLAGLARVGHLIDVGVTSDLINCLRDLVTAGAVGGSSGGGGGGAGGGAGGAGGDGSDGEAGPAAGASASSAAWTHDCFGIADAARRGAGSELGSGLLVAAAALEVSGKGTAAAASAAAGGGVAGAAAAVAGAAEDSLAAAARAAAVAATGGSGSRLSTESLFSLVTTALRILSGPGELLNADETAFVSAAYAGLLRLVGEAAAGGAGVYTATTLAADAVSALFLERRREFSPERVAAFARRCVLVAAAVPSPCAAALLSLARQLVAHYPALKGMVSAPPSAGPGSGLAAGEGSGSGAGGGGGFSLVGTPTAGAAFVGAAGAATVASAAAARGKGKGKAGKGASGAEAAAASLGDRHLDALAGGNGGAVRVPEAAGALQSTLWPLAAFAERHYHPLVRASAAAALRMTPVLPSEAPARALAAVDDREGKLHPAVPPPREHPLAAAAASAAAAGKLAKPGFVKAKPLAPWLAAALAPLPAEAAAAAAGAAKAKGKAAAGAKSKSASKPTPTMAVDVDEHAPASRAAEDGADEAAAGVAAEEDEEAVARDLAREIAAVRQRALAADGFPTAFASAASAASAVAAAAVSSSAGSGAAPVAASAAPPVPAVPISSCGSLGGPGRAPSSAFMVHFMGRMGRRSAGARGVVAAVAELRSRAAPGRASAR